MIVERSTQPAVRLQHLPRRRRRGRPRVLHRRRRPGRAADRGRRAPRPEPDPRAAHPPPLRPRLRGRRAARALAGARGPDQPARARAAPTAAARTAMRAAAGIGHDRGRRDAALRGARGAPAAHARAHRRDALVPRRRPGRRGRRGGRAGSSERPAASPAQAVVFTGDTLFKDSVGGVKAPGPHHLHRSARLDHGHADGAARRHRHLPRARRADAPSAREWEANAFIRVWRGPRPARAREPCTALGKPATLVLLGADYDGGTKAWVRWEDGSDDIVPGSRVQRSA